MVALVPGCLVTNPVEFEETSLPAHLSNPVPFSFTRVPPATDDGCREQNGWMAFKVDVSDANTNEQLAARLIVNGRQSKGANIRPTGMAQREPVSLCATLAQLSHACNLVELVVSSDFDEANFPYGTTIPGDFSKVEWWVLSPANTGPNASPEDCAALADAGVP